MVIYRMIWTPQPASVEAVAAIIETLDNYTTWWLGKLQIYNSPDT